MRNTNKNMELARDRKVEQAKIEYYFDTFVVIIKI